MRRPNRAVSWTVALAAAAVGLTSQANASAWIAEGDRAWARRAEGHQGARAEPGPIGAAVAAFERALAEDPANLEARVKLLKSLYFQGEYATESAERKLEIFQRGRDLAEEGIDRIARGFSGDPRPKVKNGPVPASLVEHLEGQEDAPGLYLWGAVHWGMSGRLQGKLAAARQGVAGRIRDYARIVVALDHRYENASGHRVLGRLHTEAPKLPLVTGWIDRDLAISELERAVELAPDDLLSQLYLIEALLEFDKSRKEEALEQLHALVAKDPNPKYLVEELKALADARGLLARQGR